MSVQYDLHKVNLIKILLACDKRLEKVFQQKTV